MHHDSPAAEPFFLYPQNQAFFTGHRRVVYTELDDTRIVRFSTLLLAFFLFFLGSVIFGYGIHETVLAVQTTTTGTATTAQIMDKTVKGLGIISSNGRSTRDYAYTLVYHYDVGTPPQMYTHKQQVDKVDYDRYAVGQHIAIRYLPDNPQNSRMIEPSSQQPWVLVVVGCFFMLGGALFGGLMLKYTLRLCRIKEDGIILSGAVESATSFMRITYTFRTPQAESMRAHTTKYVSRRSTITVPMPGTLVRIYYVSPTVFQLL